MNVKFDFSGNIALVTGAATGIGKATALEFAKAGADVIIADFNAEAGKKTSEEVAALGVKSGFYQIDVSDEKAVKAMAAQVLKDWGRIDFLISNAGKGPKHYGLPLTNIPPDDIRDQYNVNVVGYVNMVQAFYDFFKEQKSGKIVCTSSLAALRNSGIHPHYGASKIAILRFMHVVAQELGPYNINVNAIMPGFVYTPIYHEATDFKAIMPGRFDDCETSEEVVEKMAKNSAMRRTQTAEDMAYGIMFLCSDAAKEICGVELAIDSGACVM